MAIIISESMLAKIELTGEELLVDLACYLYKKKKLSHGKARVLSGLNFLDFQTELGKREIDNHYDEDDLQTDLANLNITL